jgi:hypothetical protein
MIDLQAIPGAVQVRLGVPRPDWQVVANWIDGQLPAEKHRAAWNHFTWQWLESLRDQLPGGVIEGSNHTVLLSDAADDLNSRLLRWSDYYQREIRNFLGLAHAKDHSVQILLALSDREWFCDYILDFYPEEGEFAEAGGVFIGAGMPHIVLSTASDWMIEATIAHETSHALLSHLPLPMWLDEGVTAVVEQMANPHASVLMTPELGREHRAYWNHDRIQEFWSGASFVAPDGGQRLSYSLAHVLVRNLIADYPRRITALLNSAEVADAGESALRAACGTGLAERVTQFLGPGDWALRERVEKPVGRSPT